MTIKSAIVDNEVFLQGRYLSIGINEDGSLGTKKGAPNGFYSDTGAGFERTGMYADLDGFGSGERTDLHDAILLGRAIEGFNIGYKTGGRTFVQSNQLLTGYSEVDGTIRNASSSSTGQATWNGVTSEGLAVSQKITLGDNAKYIRIDVKLTNTSDAAMNDLRYMRTADPDHGPSFVTTNRIVRQGDDDGALVASYVGKSSTPFFLFSEDSRAVVSTYGFVNSDPYAPAAFSVQQEEGFTKTADETVNITFGLGTLGAGKSTTITLYMGVTDDLGKTISAIENAGGDDDDDDDDDGDDDDDDDDDDGEGPEPVDLAPIVRNDSLTIEEGATGRGNVLSNDRDPEGEQLTASLRSGPANGTVSLSSDGSFSYRADAGFSGSDTFTYAASDGTNRTTGTVRVTVEESAPPPPPPPPPPPVNSDLLTRAGLVDGSSAADQVLTGASFIANTFYFDVDARTGSDTITNFGRNDVLVLDEVLPDGNDDRILGLNRGELSIDAPSNIDTVTLQNVSALRLVGTDSYGLAVYANASVRPDGAIEGTLRDNRLSGDTGDREGDVFFYDTALDIDLGADRINNFGRQDLFVTTSALFDRNGDGVVNFVDGAAKLTGPTGSGGRPGEAGTVALFDTDGDAIRALEFDGSVTRDGTTYFVYSVSGSRVGVDDVSF